MKKISTLLLLLVVYSVLQASSIDINKAKQIAKNIYFERVNIAKEVKYESISLNLIEIKKHNGINVYYIFNVNKNDGFVIVSADDVAKPRIAYSFEGFFNPDNISPEYAFYMKRFEEEIAYAIKNKIQPTTEIIREWQKYEFASTKNTEDIQMIEPLVQTKWGQASPYNDMCPSNTEGTALVGCVAVSMGQIMKFWNYPEHGTGSNSYYANGFGNQSANFGATNYIWTNIPNEAFSSNDDLAQLLYHCGVSINMGYGIDGSGAYGFMIDNKLEQYFSYHSDGDDISRDYYTASSWLNTIKNEIDHSRPCEYDGVDNDGAGHSWVCDGYQGDELHMNWGWSGGGDGYYAVNDLTPPGNPTFNTDGAVIGIHPPSNAYPEGCSSATKMITGIEGTFNDGSGNENYENNQDCNYHLISNCSKYVILTMNELWLSDGDTLFVYDGNSTSAPLLTAYDKNSLLYQDVYATTDKGLFLNFVTDGNGTAEGWYASYHTKNCLYTSTTYDTEGDIEDGSKTCEYNNSTSCLWWIEPTGATAIHVEFTYFELEDASDYVKIYKGGAANSSALIAELHAGDNPTNYDIADGKMTVRFGSSVNGNTDIGWKFHYTSTPASISDVENSISEINIYPNPFNTDATIEFTIEKQSDITISVKNVIGKILGTYSNYYNTGIHSIKISEIAKNLNNGIYFISYKSNNIEKTIKVVVSK